MNKFWAYVTAFGVLWGGIELTLGTFLHVLHVPKTGLMMTMLSVVLLLAQRQIFPARGSTCCVGIVAACIKCLSPGGIILGPVIGILSEALIVELFLVLSSRNVLSAGLAGAAALVWSQLYSVVKYWFYYGEDFIKGLAKVIAKFFSVQWTEALGWGILGSYFGVIFILGAFAGVAGFMMGRRAQAEITSYEAEIETERGLGQIEGTPDTEAVMDRVSAIHAGKKMMQPDEQILRTRWFMWIIALAALIAQFNGELTWSTGALAVWLLALFLAARKVLRAIWWPKFWAITLLVSILCGLILAWDFNGSWQWMTGLEATARMLVRGVFVFSMVGWATRCIRAEEFLKFWNSVHLPELGNALANAYMILPSWLERLNRLLAERPGGFRQNLRYARESLYRCLVEAARTVR